MGWFLIDRKKRPRKPRRPAGRRWDPVRTYRLLQWSGGLLVLAGLGAGWFLAEQRLRQAVAATATAGEVTVELVDLPAWMPRPVAEDLRGHVQRLVTGDPFDRQSLGRAAEVLAASPWVQRVHRVSRRPGGVIEVSATYRQGTALVRTRSGAHLIDAAGVRLPFSYTASEAKATGLAMILGVQQPMPAAGKAWEGEDLAAGLKLAACIVGQSWFGQVAGIDVSNHGGRISDRRAHLRIVTAINGEGEPLNPAGIDWGRPPGEERFFEPTAAWKLRRIATEFAKHGRLDDRVIQVTTEPGLSQRLSTDETVVTATPRL